jgi:hypothetical protein
MHNSKSIAKSMPPRCVGIEVTFWTSIREMLVSNLGPDIGYPKVFLIFLSLSKQI